MATVAMRETYADVEKLLYSVAWKFHKRYGGDWEEVFAETDLLFVRAFHTYDTKRESSFSNWLYTVVWNGLLSLQDRKRQEQRLFAYYVSKRLPKKSSFDIGQFLRDLSDDAKLVASLAIDPPIDIRCAVDGKLTARKLRNGITEFLTDMGWHPRHIRECFEEIKEVLT